MSFMQGTSGRDHGYNRPHLIQTLSKLKHLLLWSGHDSAWIMQNLSPLMEYQFGQPHGQQVPAVNHFNSMFKASRLNWGKTYFFFCKHVHTYWLTTLALKGSFGDLFISSSLRLKNITLIWKYTAYFQFHSVETKLTNIHWRLFSAILVVLLAQDIELVGWTPCYSELSVFSLQLILDGRKCPLNVILFFSPTLKPQLQRIGQRWRHHPSSDWRSARTLIIRRLFEFYLLVFEKPHNHKHSQSNNTQTQISHLFLQIKCIKSILSWLFIIYCSLSHYFTSWRLLL